MNLMTRKEFNNGVSTELTYDSWTQRIENINTPNLQNLDYSFDEKGNIIEAFPTTFSMKTSISSMTIWTVCF
ncbi:hypothetical protein MmiHf6_13960 [Methanimicrococcus hongohii]|uniref:RHS repeat protein n=1 Tax=Methanimicrococcus hongohii TaxID=3028295 RepID=A0AA96V0E8_9EURY|nr:hypothetical protein [Methanimicrococcus sp. Hf6]WNY24071.1 hypothetical protein MmiHf6_13960 [Methanimicrococcus sp. Hf6]